MPITSDLAARPTVDPRAAGPVAPPPASSAAVAPPPANAVRPVDGFEVSEAQSAKAVSLGGDPSKVLLTRAEVQTLTQAVGRRLTVGELAELFPHATLDGRGKPLPELAKLEIRSRSGTHSLGDVPVDRNGDLDVTELFRKDLQEENPNLIVRKDDEFPVPLEYTLAHSVLIVREPATRAALLKAGFPEKTGGAVVDLRDNDKVMDAVRAVGVDPNDAVVREAELARQGVKRAMGDQDQLRRILLGRVDSKINEIDIDDKVVLHGSNANAEITPTVYGSAKVNPAHPDEVILSYKRYNNQSYAGQGNWVTHLLGKGKTPQHEFDDEAMFVKLSAKSGLRMAVLAARHFYGELTDALGLKALAKRIKRDDLTTSVSPKAHGARLAEMDEKKMWAGEGDDGVNGNVKDYVIQDVFPGFNDTQRSDKALFIPRDQVDLVLESDDQQTLNIATQIGATQKGIWGTSLFDVYNDGSTAERFGGTDWYYAQEAMQS